ncbi:SDR family oxidoreductase [Gordonia crocea]|uniref:Putative short chain dehydrogenase/reductase n=1 Tax=Gordonia crocea TaxID=589162 RepID=A0A7I9UXP1_9ACTN|nr:SDR family oxidoreductase [Gordonia crocea]GED97964.1 putative short chain dehydrogenase/reductase [Gordonia crocea]
MILDMFRLDGKAAIVTGAGRGLGAATAVAFAEAGADVVISARTAADLDSVAERIRATGRRAVVVPADLSEAEPSLLVDAAIAELGRLDILVNNVGGAYPKPFLDTRGKDLDRAFNFNVTVAHEILVASVPHLLKNPDGGSVINITSAVGRLPGRGFAVYGTVKAALAHYTRVAALDLNPRIRVNAIAPGAILTSALEVVAADDGMRGAIEERTPAHRLGKPEEIAATALFLASDAGAYLTGKVLEVDGGLLAPNFDLPLPDL